MKSLQIFALFALLLVGAESSLGQMSTIQCVKADVPFAFLAGDVSFPAGEYTVAKVGSMGVLAIQGSETTKMVASNSAQSSKPSDKSKLVFHRYGDRYILSEIWVEGDSRGRRFPKTKLEKELAARASYAATDVLARK